MSLFVSKNSFEGQQEDEKVVLLLRRHWFFLVTLFAMFFVLALVPVAIYALLVEYIANFAFMPFYWFFTAVYFVFWWHGLFYRFMLYLLDVWIITDHRIIDSRQRAFFHRTISEARIHRVQDISTKVVGLIPTLLNFGDIEVQTAGTEKRFLFKQVPHPGKVRSIVIQASDMYKRKHPQGLEKN